MKKRLKKIFLSLGFEFNFYLVFIFLDFKINATFIPLNFEISNINF